MADPIEIFEGGEMRRLGTLVPATSTPQDVSTVFGGVDSAPLITRSQWAPVSYKSFFPRIKDQNGIGMCNASATGNVLEGCRRMSSNAPGTDVDLSAGDLYNRISGGVDRGSLPEDALKEAMANGMAPVTDVPYLQWKKGGPTGNRPKYRITEAYWCPTFEHMASALQQGFLIDLGIWWYSRDPVDQDGWIGVTGSGQRGGHAICGMELAERNGTWGIGFVNSWTFQWGMGGFGVMPEGRASLGANVFSAWACRATVLEGGIFPTPEN